MLIAERFGGLTVICVGLCAHDFVWNVQALPAGGGKMRALRFHESGGGMAANAAVTVVRLGAKARFWGRAGTDTIGRRMREELAGLGVGVDSFRLFDGARSSVSGIMVDGAGERSIVNFRGEGLPAPADWLPIARVAGAHAVLADMRWPEGARAAFAAAREAGIPTVLDGDVAGREAFAELLPWVDCAVFSEPGLAQCAPGLPDMAARLDAALRLGCRMAAVTLGDRGVAWTDGGPVHRQPAFPVRTVDSTGAGDVFHGAFALALAAGGDVPEAMRFASAAAALKCSRPGTREGIPDLAAVLAFLNEHEEH